jgi:hypothetical protein
MCLAQVATWWRKKFSSSYKVEEHMKSIGEEKEAKPPLLSTN